MQEMQQIRGRYLIRCDTQRRILQFMRMHSLLEKLSRKNSSQFQTLYNQIHIGTLAEDTVHMDFSKLCRRKVSNFVQAKGKLFMLQEIVKIVEDGLEWIEATRKWQDEDWNGDFSIQTVSKSISQMHRDSGPSTPAVDLTGCQGPDSPATACSQIFPHATKQVGRELGIHQIDPKLRATITLDSTVRAAMLVLA